MEDTSRYLIGLDLSKKNTKVSYWNYQTNEPEALCCQNTLEFPFVLYHTKENDSWQIPLYTMAPLEEIEAYSLENVLDDGIYGQNISVSEDLKMSYADLLSIYIDKLFMLLENHLPENYIDSIMVTIPKMHPRISDRIYQAFAKLDIHNDRISIQNHIESGIHFIRHQDFKTKKFGIFKFRNQKLVFHKVYINTISLPVHIQIKTYESGDYLHEQDIENSFINYFINQIETKQGSKLSDLERQDTIKLIDQNKQKLLNGMIENKSVHIQFQLDKQALEIQIQPDDMTNCFKEFDVQFTNWIDEVLKKDIVPVIYLAGSGFNIPWNRQALGKLCEGRRVFHGNNLFSHGACYSLLETLDYLKKPEIVITGDQFLEASIGIIGEVGGKDEFIPIIKSGMLWQEAVGEVSIYPDSLESLKIYYKKPNETAVCMDEILLSGIAERPVRTTKLNLLITCLNPTTFRVQVEDRGFGILFPPTGQVWNKTINI